MLKKLLPVALLFLFFSTSHKAVAQDEVYQPAEVEDTIITAPSKDNNKDKAEKEDARTQLEKRKERLQRIRIGTNLGFQFGTFTYIDISPTIGYMVIPDRLELGGGPIFIYERYKFSPTYKFSAFVYGPDIYARGYIWKGLYLESRYDLVNKPSVDDFNRKLWVSHLLLGAGYAAQMGKIGFFNVSAVFNVLNSRESIYRGTFGDFPLILNFGFAFGIGGRNQ
jgi:hypothetical protein